MTPLEKRFWKRVSSDVKALIVSVTCLLALSACGSRPVNVEYTPDTLAPQGDWFPIPVESSVTVTSADRVVERPPVRIQESRLNSGSGEPLAVTEGIDSFGNVSLEVNRPASLTWELLNAAVRRLEWPVSDRNRSEYRIELADPERASRGFFGRIKAFFSEERQPVNLILVPKVNATGISAEYPDDKTLAEEDNRRLMTQLREELLQGQ